jgi:tRNA pseudouridine38-40 synthase
LKRIKITIAYDGTLYCGWQVQPSGTSIQTLVQKALETILRHPIALTGSGRTDAGVHALGQTAHFDTKEPVDLSRLSYAANALLPPDVRILSATPEEDSFHARYSATGKVYYYHLQLGERSDPTTRLYRTPIYGSFDANALREAAAKFLGTHDFHAFANTKEDKPLEDSIRTLTRLDVLEEEGGLRLEFEGDGFLYKMVRNLTGTLIEVAKGKRRADEISSLLQQKDRRLSGATAPPQGLFLMQVIYARNLSPSQTSLHVIGT